MDNGRMKRSIEVNVGDLLVLRHALRIAVTTAMMYGRSLAEARLKVVEDQIKALIGEEMVIIDQFFEDHCACEIVARLQQAEHCEVLVSPVSWEARRHGFFWSRHSKGKIEVRITSGGETYQYLSDSIERYDQDGWEVKAVFTALRSLAPCGVDDTMTLGSYKKEQADAE